MYLIVMRMFLTADDHNQFLSDCVAKHPKRVFISTFGTYLGITYDGRDTTTWGEEYRLATRDLAESMRDLPDVNILVGVSNYRSCKNQITCLDCEKQYVRTLLRHVNHAELFPEFNWKMTTELHLKSMLFYYDVTPKHHEHEYPDGLTVAEGVTGGRNFTDSDWTDVSVVIGQEQITEIEKLAEPVWDEAYDITDTNAGKIFEEQKISERGFESVLDGIEVLGKKNQDIPF
jgi:hypothetical protein